jgi:CHASE2 domain-containing sensor protein
MSRFKSDWITALIAALLFTIFVQFLEFKGWFAGPEGMIRDSLLAGGSRNTASHSPIVVVEIDDASYSSCFNSTSPLNPEVVCGLVGAVAARRPTVIGVDILTDAPHFIAQYRAMAVEFSNSRPKIIWISGAEKWNFEGAPFYWWLFGGKDHLTVKPTRVLGYEPWKLIDQPKIAWSVPVFPPDNDAGLRRFLREVYLSADPQTSVLRERRTSWARRVAEEYIKATTGNPPKDNDADEIFLSYHKDKPAEFKLSEIGSCAAPGTLVLDGAQWQEFKKTAPGKIVLIGGTFGSARDFYSTPNGRIPGLLINAYAAQAELDGDFVLEAPRKLAAFLDFLLGYLIGAMVFKEHIWAWLRRRSFPMQIIVGLRKIPLLKWCIDSILKTEVHSKIVVSLISLAAAGAILLLVFRLWGYLFSFTALEVGWVVDLLHELWDWHVPPAVASPAAGLAPPPPPASPQ